jgi:Tfp pilus assembly protein PilF
MSNSNGEISAPEQARALIQQAQALQWSGNIDTAIRMYRESISIFPTADAHTHLGWAYSRQGNIDAAIEECKRAIEIDPDYGNPYNDIGAYLIEQQRYQEAIVWLEKALDAPVYNTPHFPHFNLARIAERYGEWGSAMHHYQTSYKLAPTFKPALQGILRLQAMMN